MNLNILFVSAFLDLHEDRSKDKSVPTCFNHFKNLASSGIPILLFLSKSYEDYYRKLGPLPNVRMEFMELDQLQTFYDVPENLVLLSNRTVHHDTRNFMILINAKIEFVKRAMDLVPEAKHVAWIDFSICHVFRNREETLAHLSMLSQSRLKDRVMAIPGCWNKGIGDVIHGVCWRYCGGFFLGDRESLIKWSALYRTWFPTLVKSHGLLWEVNVWTLLEQLNDSAFQPHWFKADHNDTIVKVPGSCYSIAACLTTIPSRINADCIKAIESIQDQVDHVYLAISPSYVRFPDASMVVPEFGPKVTVVLMSDKGPANKYLVSLSPQTRGQWLFFCDDDQEYREGLVERMMNSVDSLAVYQNRCTTIKGQTSGGLIHGYVGNLVHRSLLTGLDSFDLPECARHTDDQWLSIFYHLHGIRVKGTGIEAYEDIFKILEQGRERWSVDSLASLGTRWDKVQQVAKHFGVRYMGDYDGVMMYLTDVSVSVQGAHSNPWMEGYTPSSSSFCSVGDRNYLNVRYVNYSQTPEGRYHIWDPKGALRTQNILMELDASFQQVKSSVMNVNCSRPLVRTDINGLEDIRLYSENRQLKFIGTQCQWTPVSRMVIGDVSVSRSLSPGDLYVSNARGVGDVSGTEFQNITVLEPPSWTGCEKNWIPLGANKFIYQWHPLQIGAPENGVLKIVQEWPTPSVFHNLRGSTIFHPFGPHEVIGVVHSSVEGSPRHYYHRLVVLDAVSYKPLRYTPPFVFGRVGIEFCIGMSVVQQHSHRMTQEKGNHLRFWYSQHDRDPIWVSVPLSTFRFLSA